MATLRHLSKHSDIKEVSWDPDALTDKDDPTGQKAAQRAVREAERIFDRHRRSGGTVLSRQEDGTYKTTRRFEPDADELILVPAVAGG